MAALDMELEAHAEAPPAMSRQPNGMFGKREGSFSMLAIRLLRAVAMATLAATVASGVAGQYDEVSVTEYVTLPKFCWYQFSDGKVQGQTPEYGYFNCGGHMNHYCYGLLDLQRSKKAKTVDERRNYLKSARTNTHYTLNGMNQDGVMATCSITPHVQATMRSIDLQMQIYNLKK